MSAGPPSSNHDRQARLLALAAEVRPELHRYCARLMGSVIDGEDVVQDTLLRALVALQDLEETAAASALAVPGRAQPRARPAARARGAEG